MGYVTHANITHTIGREPTALITAMETPVLKGMVARNIIFLFAASISLSLLCSWHDTNKSFICQTWFTWVTWLVHGGQEHHSLVCALHFVQLACVRDVPQMSHSYVSRMSTSNMRQYSYRWHDSFQRLRPLYLVQLAVFMTCVFVTCPKTSHEYDRYDSYAWRDSFMLARNTIFFLVVSQSSHSYDRYDSYA